MYPVRRVGKNGPAQCIPTLPKDWNAHGRDGKSEPSMCPSVAMQQQVESLSDLSWKCECASICGTI